MRHATTFLVLGSFLTLVLLGGSARAEDTCPAEGHVVVADVLLAQQYVGSTSCYCPEIFCGRKDVIPSCSVSCDVNQGIAKCECPDRSDCGASELPAPKCYCKRR
jgi:hypothetical protein